MVEVYKHMDMDAANDAVLFGLKCSEWADMDLLQGGETRKYITAFLHPKDQQVSDEKRSVCLNITVRAQDCYVCDRALYQTGEPRLDTCFYHSLILIRDYQFGEYAQPICLIGKTILAEAISKRNVKKDSPILTEASKIHYANRLFGEKREKRESITNAMLYAYYDAMYAQGRIEKFVVQDENRVIFVNAQNRTVALAIPEEEDWCF